MALTLAFFISIPNFCVTGQAQATNELVIQSVTVNDKSMPLRPSEALNLGPFPKTISFSFCSADTNAQPPLRLRGKLEGFESGWHEGNGNMFLAIRFLNASGDQIDQKTFQASGESAGWNGSLNSPFTHRRETLIVPPQASHAWIVISSAGPPTTVGIYVVANLVMTENSDNSPPAILIESPFDYQTNSSYGDNLRHWARSGTHMSMAKIIHIGQEPSIKAFAIEDDDPNAHAEWYTSKEIAPKVQPGSRLVIEWNEMYSIGEAGLRSVLYSHLDLLPGSYRFHIIGIDLMGNPTGIETSMKVFVPHPFWKRPLSWTMVAIFFTAIIVGSARYLVWRRMRREMLLLRNQQALERERLRIARDIHDDLGARVTQISMVSAASLHDPALSDKTRMELSQIKQMSRDLVSALYETVWTVNPEYDNLDALGSYLCQMVDQLCKQTSLQCRLHVSELPHKIQVSSHIRHNITMAMKEAMHNIIKHAKGSEVAIHIALKGNLLDISIQDNGYGFQPINAHSGNGLTNMRQRMEDIGGSCSIESKPGSGTTVCLRLTIHQNDATNQLPKGRRD